jgi:hypothetical protein
MNQGTNEGIMNHGVNLAHKLWEASSLIIMDQIIIQLEEAVL